MKNKSVGARSTFVAMLLALPVVAWAQQPGRGWTMPGEDEPAVTKPKPPVAADAYPAQASSEDAARIVTAGLYNRHLNTALKTTMGGAQVAVAGQFLRDQKTAFLCLSSPRWRSPVYFNIKGLLDNEVDVTLGGTQYKISLELSAKGKMYFQVKIDPANFAATLQQLLDSTYQAGLPVTLGGVEHRLAYYNEIAGDLQGTVQGQRTFALMSTDPREAGAYFTYVFPEEDLASGAEHTYTFKDRPYRTMKVQLQNGVLQIRASR